MYLGTEVGIRCWQQTYAWVAVSVQIEPLYRDGSIESIFGYHWHDRHRKASASVSSWSLSLIWHCWSSNPATATAEVIWNWWDCHPLFDSYLTERTVCVPRWWINHAMKARPWSPPGVHSWAFAFYYVYHWYQFTDASRWSASPLLYRWYISFVNQPNVVHLSPRLLHALPTLQHEWSSTVYN